MMTDNYISSSASCFTIIDMKFSLLMYKWVFIFILSCFSFSTTAQNLPVGFVLETVVDDPILQSSAGIRFVNDSVSLAWTLSGKVFMLLNNVLDPNPLIDISEEVGYWGDYGMAGMAIDPDFDENGLIYLMYNADVYYMQNYGTPDYEFWVSWNYQANLGRIARHQVTTIFPYEHLPEATEYLIGETLHDGIPMMSSSHGLGTLEFGTDGSLLATCGDGSTWVQAFAGGPPYPEFAYDVQGMELGILREDENIGAFRSQYLGSLNGKLLRIDPETGAGIPSNPFYMETHPDSSISKVWGLGLRNPFRMVRRPGTGSADPLSGDPGKFYIADVGFTDWEEINVARGPGSNFGWPIMEGMQETVPYLSFPTEHPFYVNALYDGELCDNEHLLFQDLLVQPKADHSSSWTNSCDRWVELSDTLIKHVHTRPRLAYANAVNSQGLPYASYTPSYDATGQATGMAIEENPNIEGESFEGIACLGGDFYYGATFPEEYFGAFFVSDYSGWIRALWFNENDELIKLEPFLEGFPPAIHMRFNPFDDCLYMQTASSQRIYRICFQGNVPPKAIIDQDAIYGPSPLIVDFSAINSYDQDGDDITFHWDFGDSGASDAAEDSHEFIAPDNAPLTFTVTLEVTDSEGNVGTAETLVSLNNSPPQVSITGIPDDAVFHVDVDTTFPLIADVADAEHSDESLSYRWQTILIHNDHQHPEPIVSDHVSEVLIPQLHCSDLADYAYLIKLEVEDPEGLKGFDEKMIAHDCEPTVPLEPDSDPKDYTIGPNPSNGSFIIRGLPIPEEEFRLRLCDMKGSVISDQTKKVDAFGRLSFRMKPAYNGLFLLEMSNEKERRVFKVMVDRSIR